MNQKLICKITKKINTKLNYPNTRTLCETGVGEVLLHFLHGSEQHSRLGVAEDGESEVGAVEEQARLRSLLEAEDAAVVDEVHVLVSSQGDS